MQQQVQVDGTIVTLIHFCYLTEPKNEERIACSPNMKELGETMYHPNCQRTNDFRAVTCPSCKRSDMYIAAMGPAAARNLLSPLDAQRMHNAPIKK